MRTTAITAMIFSNSNDEALKELTEIRSMASLPFGGRYRLIDFALSNLVNAGISNIGVVTNENYSSLLDHIESGVFWDLDRKNGGLHIIPPFIRGTKKYRGYADALYRAAEYISNNSCEYVVAYDSGIAANVDISALINAHIEKDADVTFVYRNSDTADKLRNTLKIEIDETGKITELNKVCSADKDGRYTMGIAVFKKSAFLSVLNSTIAVKDDVTFSDFMANSFSNISIYGFEHNGFTAVMDCRKAYFENSMKLLNKEIRDDLFNRERPVYTKTRDDMPTRYGTHSDVKNSLVADGCIIDGTVKNCILFRGVHIRKGATAENSILMQGVDVRENAVVKYVVSDKNAVIDNKEPVCGTNRKAFIIKKNQMI